MNSSLIKLKLTPAKVQAKLEEYKQSATPTYKGFLRYLGLGSKEFKEMIEYSMNPKNENWVKIVRIIDHFKLDMEVKMEEYMLYQYNHPDLKNVPNYNFNLLEKLLRYSDKSYYGEKSIVSIDKKPNEKNVIKILENKSEVKWSK